MPAGLDTRALVWRGVRRTGLGRLCSKLNGGRLQILCYHGFSFQDEHRFRGKLFMTTDLFEQRLEWLRRHRFTVLALDEAVRRLADGRLRSREIVITIDDGFHGVHALAAPRLRACGFPATVYVTTYYVKHPNPIFRLAIQYMAWKCGRDAVSTSGLLSDLCETTHLRGPLSERSLQAFYERAEAECTENERVELAREFGRRVGVDYEELRLSRRMSLMSPEEVTDLCDKGFDIQLHTHRHRLPLDAIGITREIEDNRAFLSRLVKNDLEHLCYPSGVWDAAQWPALSSLGIKTATTCNPGFNARTTPLLGLRRFLDGQEISMDEFGAEMFGVKDVIRRVRGVVLGGRVRAIASTAD